jgi:hypothetical protein
MQPPAVILKDSDVLVSKNLYDVLNAVVYNYSNPFESQPLIRNPMAARASDCFGIGRRLALVRVGLFQCSAVHLDRILSHIETKSRRGQCNYQFTGRGEEFYNI